MKPRHETRLAGLPAFAARPLPLPHHALCFPRHGPCFPRNHPAYADLTSPPARVVPLLRTIKKDDQPQYVPHIRKVLQHVMEDAKGATLLRGFCMPKVVLSARRQVGMSARVFVNQQCWPLAPFFCMRRALHRL